MLDREWWGTNWQAAFPHGVRLSVVVPVYNERYLVAEAIGRLLALEIEGVATIEIVVVDDGSTDGSGEILAELAAAHDDRIILVRKERNGGKGAALRTGIERTTGDLVVFQDADLEYDPRDFGRMIHPFFEDGADVVYGSRFAASNRRRILYLRHSAGNHVITLLSNLFTNLSLTDVETCYKMFRGPLLRSIPIRSDDFGIEIELTAKIAKRRCTIFEVPVSYRGRSYSEGKKIGWWDAFRALVTMVRFWLIDDLYRADGVGARMLHTPDRTRRFNGWMGRALRPWVGDRVLELRAGLGHVTMQLIPRDAYVVSDVSTDYLHYLRNTAAGKPYLEVAAIDPEDPATIEPYEGQFDTLIAWNVLNQTTDPGRVLAEMSRLLTPGGRLLLSVPQGPGLSSPLDEAQGHRRRYRRQELEHELLDAGFTIEHIADFNRVSVPGWWWNGKILRRRSYPRLQLKAFDLLVPLLSRIDGIFPWRGLGLLAVARREAPAGS
jgi:glycosyltransferase involved in cell wall biosynthesis